MMFTSTLRYCAKAANLLRVGLFATRALFRKSFPRVPIESDASFRSCMAGLLSVIHGLGR